MKKNNNLITFTLINLLIIGVGLWALNNYIVTPIDWLLNLLGGFEYTKQLLLALWVLLAGFVVSFFLAGTITQTSVRANTNLSLEFIKNGFLLYIVYLIIDGVYLSVNYSGTFWSLL